MNSSWELKQTVRKNNFSQKFTLLLALTKARMCLFLGYYAAFLFVKEDNKELFAQHVKFIIECVGCADPDIQSVPYQACQTILDMLSEKNTVFRLVPFVGEILEQLTTFVKESSCISFFDAIQEIIKMYSPALAKTPQRILNLLAVLVERAKAEYEEVKGVKNIPKLVLNKIWNIIRSVGELQDYILKFQEDIEKILIPLFSYLATDEDIPFDVDILGYVNSTVMLTKRVSPVTWEIFKIFPKIFDGFKGLITPLFPALNQIIAHGKDAIEGNYELIHTLVEMGIQGMNTTHKDAGKAGYAMAALHFQILIQYVGIPDNEWERMLEACISRLLPNDKSFLKAR